MVGDVLNKTEIMKMDCPENGFFVTSNFYMPDNSLPFKTWELNWNSRDDVRAFAAAANDWLRNGAGYRVETFNQ